MIQQTLGIIKPNASRKNVAGKIISIWEEAGLKVLGIQKVHLTQQQAQGFYKEHEGKFFFDELVAFMTSGPVFLVALEGEDAVLLNRRLMGATNPQNAEPGTIRALYGDSFTQNAVHGSDSPESAAREISYFFNVFQLVP